LQSEDKIFPARLSPRIDTLTIVVEHLVSQSNKFMEGSNDSISKLGVNFGELYSSEEERISDQCEKRRTFTIYSQTFPKENEA
jgi:hypothetical protein